MRINSDNMVFNVSCVLVKDFSLLFWSKFSPSMLKSVSVTLLIVLLLVKPPSFSALPVLTLQSWSKVMVVLNI